MDAFTPAQEERLREIVREEIKADQDRRAARAQDILKRLGESGLTTFARTNVPG